MDKVLMVVFTAVIAFGTLAAAYFAHEAYELEVIKSVQATSSK